MGTGCSGSAKVYFPSTLVHFIDDHLNNNTPVNTEVLWGGGGLLRAGAPMFNNRQYVINVIRGAPLCDHHE